jgi:hypothetical protein
MASFADWLLGEQEADTPSGYIPLPEDIQKIVDEARRYAKKSVAESEAAYMDPAQFAQLQSSRQLSGIAQGTTDARSQLQDMLARRGMQNSSMAFQQNNLNNRYESERQAQIRANIPLIEQEQRLKQADQTAKNAQLIAASAGPMPDYVKGQKGGRKGGLLPIIGTVGGGIVGGIASGGNPMGIAAGASMGGGLATQLSQSLGGSTDYNPQAAQSSLSNGLSAWGSEWDKANKPNVATPILQSSYNDPSQYNNFAQENPYLYDNYMAKNKNKYSLGNYDFNRY